MKTVKVGVVGVYRGTSMINYCKVAKHAKVVAICDKNVQALEEQRALIQDDSVTCYTSFDEFIQHDMDAVVLASTLPLPSDAWRPECMYSARCFRCRL